MKPIHLIVLSVAASLSFATADEEKPTPPEKTVTEKTKAALTKAGETTKDAINKAAEITKDASKALVDAVSPDVDATPVAVTVDDVTLNLPAKVAAGKTAFVVKNNGKEKHNFRVKGDGVDERFLLDVKPADSKVMHITLKPGMYEITCPDNEKALGMKRTLTVE